MAKPMSQTLFTAILAMDSYNRGYNAYVANLPDTPGTQIGNAYITDTSGTPPAIVDGFYAVSYIWGGTTVISYRGTDNLSVLTDDSSDLSNGWPVGAGILTSQTTDAENFYKTVTTFSALSGTTVNNVLLTGHSLGGGLAGYIAALTGDKAEIFDNMPYAAAAYVTAEHNTLATPNASGIISEYTSGEILAAARLAAPAAAKELAGAGASLAALLIPEEQTDLPVLNAHGGGITTPIELHSMALLVLLQYASDNSLTAWQTVGQQLFSSYFNENLASALGLSQGSAGTSGVGGTTGNIDPATQMLDMIGYSAVNVGAMPFGDTGIVSLFHDADELGE